jgi:hypothetical protein
VKRGAAGPVWTCHRAAVDAPSIRDWTEWEAGRASAGILTPATELRAWAGELLRQTQVKPPLVLGTGEAWTLISLVSQRCDVSESAARIRLVELG